MPPPLKKIVCTCSMWMIKKPFLVQQPKLHVAGLLAKVAVSIPLLM